MSSLERAGTAPAPGLRTELSADRPGPVAIVTGGGTGIGQAVSTLLSRSGAGAVVVTYSRSEEEAQATADQLEHAGTRAEAVRADVANEAAVKDMVGHVQRKFGRIDYLVNCAGVTRFIPFSDLDALTDEVWNEILRVNVLGAFYCARAAASALRESHGAIVNITSVAAHRASGSSLPYSVSKAAELQLTKGLAVSLAPEVRVNAVSPGLVATRWHTARQSAEDMARQIERVASATPLQRVSTPEDVAQAVLGFLQNRMVTGECVMVDGGKHLLY